MTKVTNSWGTEIDYDIAVECMDDDIRERIHYELAPCTEQEFFDAYAKAYKKAFGAEWEFEKRNPTY